jgi:hypothetical protein
VTHFGRVPRTFCRNGRGIPQAYEGIIALPGKYSFKRKAEPTSRAMNARRQRLVVLVAAAVAATSSTIAAHKWWLRDRPWFLAVGKEVELNELLDLPLVDPGWAPLELMDDPRSAAFLRFAAQHVKPYVAEEGKSYWVWMIPFAGTTGRARGWPIVSGSPDTDVYIEESFKVEHCLILTEDGSPRIRYIGVLGNLLFYFLIFLPLAWIGNLPLRWLASRFRRPKHGFPVIQDADGSLGQDSDAAFAGCPVLSERKSGVPERRRGGPEMVKQGGHSHPGGCPEGA